ncbi:hypothetical protein [Lamprobacter modestohalophilus]|uniref:hypothetical protein n=1 Tax=Lamprobacter modestohalophilus TaxID=1064514 RepID=UPI0019049970|nr:hypothetical protein [Lamprobacter modestohalophilus]
MSQVRKQASNAPGSVSANTPPIFMGQYPFERLRELPASTGLCACEAGDTHQAVGSTQHRGDGDYNHVAELVVALQLAARVLKIGEVANKRTVQGERGYCGNDWSAFSADKDSKIISALKVYFNATMQLL